jgi:hypothetical protein
MEDPMHCQVLKNQATRLFLLPWLMLSAILPVSDLNALASELQISRSAKPENSQKTNVFVSPSSLSQVSNFSIAQKTDSARSDSATQTAQNLAEKVIEKLGGLDKIRKFNASLYRARGNVVQISSLSGSSNTLPCEIVAQGHKQWVSVTFMGQPVVTGYDGKDCWTMQGTNAMPTDPITAQRVREDLEHGLLLVEKLLERGRKLTLEPSKVINGIKCDALSAVSEDGKPTTFFIDPATSLIIRTEYHGSDIEQGIDCIKAYDYMDYRRVNGTLQPFKAIEYSDDKKVSIVEISSIETDLKLSDDIFKMPNESKIARLRSGPVRIPFQYTSSEILVMASINGLPNKLFIVDTGATQSIVDTQFFKEIAKPTTDEIEITTGSGAMKMSFAQLKTFQLGEIELKDVSVAIADLSKFAQFLAVRPHGLIGANILKRFLITIDYDKQELILRDPDKVKPPEGAIVVDTKPSLGVSGLAVEGILDNQLKLTFLIDSGAAFNHVSESLIKGLTQAPLLPVGVIKGLDGTPVKTGAIKFKTLDIGKLSIEDPIFSVAPSVGNEDSPKGIISGGALAIIGNPLLSRYRVTIDYRNQKIYFEETANKSIAALEGRLKRILADFYKQDDARATSNQLAHLATDALSEGSQDVAALAMAHEALYLSQIGNKSAQKESDSADTGDSKIFSLLRAPSAAATKAIQDKFVTAYDYAKRSERKNVIAKVLSLWAQYFVQSGSKGQTRARSLINMALAACPTEPAVYAVAGLLYANGQSTLQADKLGRATANATTIQGGDDKTESSADMLLNQSLMLDPSNWLALWTKYDLAARYGKSSEKAMLSKHLLRYYPDAVRVKQLQN